jgi:tRNA A37 threonylcarbamoyladenosine dehydratase
MTRTEPRFERLARLIGAEAVEKLSRSAVAIVGLGGVGGICAEALARSGVGRLVLVDGDAVEPSNLNRQIVATEDVVGRNKALLMAERARSINPSVIAEAYPVFFRRDEFPLDGLDYVVDAIDRVEDKANLIEACIARGIPVISSTGAGKRLDPAAFRVATIEGTSIDPLARIMRKKLKERGISGVKAVYSTEKPMDTGPAAPGSFMPAVAAAGLLLAAEVIRDLLRK